MRLSRWKTIQNMKIMRFQSLNFTSTLKGYLFQTVKLWKELVELKQTLKKPRLKLENGKMVN